MVLLVLHFETTEKRLTFLIHIHVHASCDNKPVSVADVENYPVTKETTKVSTSETGGKTTEKIIRMLRENPKLPIKNWLQHVVSLRMESIGIPRSRERITSFGV